VILRWLISEKVARCISNLISEQIYCVPLDISYVPQVGKCYYKGLNAHTFYFLQPRLGHAVISVPANLFQHLAGGCQGI
jgi:hypothetical protein